MFDQRRPFTRDITRHVALLPVSVICLSSSALGDPSTEYITTEEVWSATGEVHTVDPPAAPKTYYGDELGYSANGVSDVDGDGHQDFAVSFYQTPRDIDGNSTIDLDEHNVGLVRVYSGDDYTQIGGDIVGEFRNDAFPHEIEHIHDLNGDGRAELLIGNSATDYSAGSVWVFAYTDEYNADGVSGERWVNLYRINGDNPGTFDPNDSEPGQTALGFRVKDVGNIDGDAGHAHDIMVGSRFFRTADSGPYSGHAWVFCMPSSADMAEYVDDFKTDIATANWDAVTGFPKPRPGATDTPDGIIDALPVVISSDQATLEISSSVTPSGSNNTHFAEALGGLGDVDGDGMGSGDADDLPDLVIGAPKHENSDGDDRAGRVFIFLSQSSVRKDTTTGDQDFDQITNLSVAWNSTSDTQEVTTGSRFLFESDDADYIIEGEEPDDEFGFYIVSGHTLNNDEYVDLAVLAPGHSGETNSGKVYLYRIDEEITTHPTATVEWDADDGSVLAASINDPSDDYPMLRIEPAGNADGDPSGDIELLISAPNYALVYNINTGLGGSFTVSLQRILEGEGTEPSGYYSEESLRSTLDESHFKPSAIRAWPAWDTDHDGSDDLLITSWLTGKLIDGVTEDEDNCTQATQHASVSDHDETDGAGTAACTEGEKHDPYVRAGKAFLVLSPTADLIFDDGFSCPKLDTSIAITIKGAGLTDPDGNGEASASWDPMDADISVEPDLLEEATPYFTGTGSLTSASGYTEITGLTLVVQAEDVTTGCRKFILKTGFADRVGYFHIPDGSSCPFPEVTCSSTMSAYAPQPPADIDGDTVISPGDISELLTLLGETDPENEHADLNDDGYVDVIDLELLIRLMSE